MSPVSPQGLEGGESYVVVEERMFGLRKSLIRVRLNPTDTNAEKRNLNRLRKCSTGWQFRSLFYTLESKEGV